MATTIGDTNITHPIITFKIKLDRHSSEKIGPNTNSRNVNLLHPDMHDGSPDRGYINSLEHAKQSISWLSGFLAAENLNLGDDLKFTAYGQKATYLKKTYADVAEPYLEVVTYTFASE